MALLTGDCSACGRAAERSNRAAVTCDCHAARYCSPECQNDDLAWHRRECSSLLLHELAQKRQALTRLKRIRSNDDNALRDILQAEAVRDRQESERARG